MFREQSCFTESISSHESQISYQLNMTVLLGVLPREGAFPLWLIGIMSKPSTYQVNPRQRGAIKVE